MKKNIEKRNPQDTTLRNARAASKRLDALEKTLSELLRIVRLMQMRVTLLDNANRYSTSRKIR